MAFTSNRMVLSTLTVAAMDENQTTIVGKEETK